METRSSVRARILAIAIATCFAASVALLAGCRAPAPPDAVDGIRRDHLQRPEYFRQLFDELKRRPELHGQPVRLRGIAYFYDDGTVMLKVQQPGAPETLLDYHYQLGYGDTPAQWSAPLPFRQAGDPATSAPPVIDIDALPLKGMAAANANREREIHRLIAAAGEDGRRRSLLEGLAADLSFIVAAEDGEPRWESEVNPFHIGCMSSWRVRFHADGHVDSVEETPDPHPADCADVNR